MILSLSHSLHSFNKVVRRQSHVYFRGNVSNKVVNPNISNDDKHFVLELENNLKNADETLLASHPEQALKNAGYPVSILKNTPSEHGARILKIERSTKPVLLKVFSDVYTCSLVNFSKQDLFEKILKLGGENISNVITSFSMDFKKGYPKRFVLYPFYEGQTLLNKFQKDGWHTVKKQISDLKKLQEKYAKEHLILRLDRLSNFIVDILGKPILTDWDALLFFPDHVNDKNVQIIAKQRLADFNKKLEAGQINK